MIVRIFIVLVTVSTVFAQSEMPWTKTMCHVAEVREKLSTVPFGTDPQSKLIKSISFCDYQAAIALIGSGMDFNFEDKSGRGPLSVALSFGENDIMQELLRHGANPNRVSHKGSQSTVLMGAAFSGNGGAVKLLLDRGAKLNQKDVYRGTALMYAAERGHMEIVKLLLERGADPRLRDKFGHTASDSAAQAKHPEIAELLKSAEEHSN